MDYLLHLSTKRCSDLQLDSYGAVVLVVFHYNRVPRNHNTTVEDTEMSLTNGRSVGSFLIRKLAEKTQITM